MAFKKWRQEPESPPSKRIVRRGVPQNDAQNDTPAATTNNDNFNQLEAELYADDAGLLVQDGQAAKPVKTKKHRSVKKVIFMLLALLLIILIVAGVAIFLAILNVTKNDDLWLDLTNVAYREGTVLYYTDTQTGETATYVTIQSVYDREYVSWGDIPQSLKDAFVAVEDKNFYSHNGIDLKRTVYAFANELKYTLTGSYIGGDSGRKQGASTITQQLIKNLTGDDEASGLQGYFRKIVEIYRALRLEQNYTKDEILCAYLNVVGFTGRSEGVQAESTNLFGKSVSELSIAESASIAGITRSPARYNPVTNPETHIERRNYILGEMLEQGYITQEEYEQAIAEPLQLSETAGSSNYTEPIYDYFTETVFNNLRDELMQQRGITSQQASDLIYNGGLAVYTTVVPELQASMEEVMQSGSYFNYGGVQVQQQAVNENGDLLYDSEGGAIYETVTVYPEAAMVSLNYEGGITAIVGGLGEKTVRRPFNRATSATRQIGSTAKAIAPYVLAIENNTINWSSAFLDDAVMEVENETTGEIEAWPSNVSNYYTQNDILVYNAFAQSVNTVAVRVGQTVGVNRMYNFLRNDVGITTLVSEDKDYGPLVLGSNHVGITPLELAMAYSMFGNGGYIYTTHSFTTLQNRAGASLLQVTVESEQVISSETAYIMNRLLRQVMVGNGTASGKSVAGAMDSVGKTGTTTDHRDNWFVGLTPYYVTAVWYGYDDNVAPLSVNNAQHPCILAWKNVMETSQTDLEYREFPTSADVHEHYYCTVSGHAAGSNCPSAIGYYTDDNPPDETACPVHG